VNVEIETQAVQFFLWEHINGIFIAVQEDEIGEMELEWKKRRKGGKVERWKGEKGEWDEGQVTNILVGF
jgi:hypothetical protein